MKLTRFEDLDCWKEARQLTRQVYEAIGRNLESFIDLVCLVCLADEVHSIFPTT